MESGGGEMWWRGEGEVKGGEGCSNACTHLHPFPVLYSAGYSGWGQLVQSSLMEEKGRTVTRRGRPLLQVLVQSNAE